MPKEMIYYCPNCHQKYLFTEDRIGVPYQCDSCHKYFTFQIEYEGHDELTNGLAVLGGISWVGPIIGLLIVFIGFNNKELIMPGIIIFLSSLVFTLFLFSIRAIIISLNKINFYLQEIYNKK